MNSTISICVVLNVGYLDKEVLLALENEGNTFNVFQLNISPIYSALGENLATDVIIEGPIVFQPGSSTAINSTQCINMEIINDDAVEDTEKILLILNPRSTGCKLYGDPYLSGILHLKIIPNPADGKCCVIQTSP